MNRSELLDEISTSLLKINKEIFHSTGTAPKLAVYVTDKFITKLIAEGNFEELRTRERELLADATIMGYSIYTVSKEVIQHPVYQIVQIHNEGPFN